MPAPRQTITKLYWTTGEVAQLLQVNASWIRFYCDEIILEDPKRSGASRRMFTKEQVTRLKKAKELSDTELFTTKGIAYLIKHPKHYEQAIEIVKHHQQVQSKVAV